MQALYVGMGHLILDTPQGCAMWLEIAVHLPEDPATLQAAMEPNNHSTLTRKILRCPLQLSSQPLTYCVSCMDTDFKFDNQVPNAPIRLSPGFKL